MRFPLNPINGGNPKALLEQDAIWARGFYYRQLSPSSIKSYQKDWNIYEAWCARRRLQSLPADPTYIALFLSNQAAKGIKASTITRRKAAIRYYHVLAGVEPCPTDSELVRATMKGIQRSLSLQKNQKAPVTIECLMNMLQFLPDNLIGVRDKAILLFGFAGAFRRSELAALQMEDLVEVPQGLRVIIRRSKTDQEGEGQAIPIIRGKKECPVESLKQWIRAAGIEKGPVFRRFYKWAHVSELPLTGHSISRIVKKYAAKAGYEPEQFSGHSLRSGFLTSAAMNGASIFKMMAISRHKSVRTLQLYVRMADEFKDHAGDGLL